MEKEDVLKSIHPKMKNQMDERELFIYQKGSQMAYISMLIMTCIFVFINYIYHRDTYDVLCMYFIGSFVLNLYQGISLKSMKKTIYAMIAFGFFIFFLILFIKSS